MPYIGQGLQQGRRQTSTFTATASQTTFAHSYTPGYVDVYQNGILLAPGDYTATNGTQIVLAGAAALDDEITIISQHLFSVADVVSASSGGTFSGNVTVTGNLTVQGSTITVDTATTQTVDLGDDDKIRLGNDNDFQIYHNSTNNHSYISETGSGTLRLLTNRMQLRNAGDTMTFINAQYNKVALLYNGNDRIYTTNDGVTVTGTVVSDGITTNDDIIINSSGLHASGCLQINNSSTSNNFPKAIEAYNSGISAGQRHQIMLGKDGSNYDTSTISYYYAGDASTSNRLEFGFWGAGSLLNVQGDGNVGIGTDSPSKKLHIKDSIPDIRLEDTDTNAVVELRGNTGTGSFVIATDVNNAISNSKIIFEVDNDEKVRIDNNGTLLVGRDADADSTAGAMIRGTGFIQSTRDGSLAADFNRLSSHGDIIRFQKDGVEHGTIGSGTGELVISTPSGIQYISQKLTGDSDGLQYSNSGSYHLGPWLSKDNAVDLGRAGGRWKDLYLSGGAYIGGTGSANYLDDYEEGSFTPTLSWYTPSNGSVSYIARTAYYIRVGRAVTIHLEMRLNLVSQNSATLPLLVDGFPFPFRNTGGYGGSLMQVSLQGFTFSSGHIPYGWGEYNSTRMFLFTMSSGNLNTNLPTPPNYKTINVSGTYITP